jgi:hypothetical protein
MTDAPEDPFRDDAAVVWREMRSAGPSTALDLAEKCFPITFGRSDPLYDKLMRASYRRVIDSIVWMRHRGVAVWASPGSPTVFSLSEPGPEVWTAATSVPDDEDQVDPASP